MLVVRPSLYQKAMQTEGFFSEGEASLLIASIAAAGKSALMLEIGSYLGRSSLFALSALSEGQRWLIVDSFRTAAAYRDHSFWLLDAALERFATILPCTLQQAYPHLCSRRFDLVFVDGDHSFIGFATDIALSLALLNVGGMLLCHDVSETFPGVSLTVSELSAAGVIAEEERAESLVRFRVCARPTWLIDPEPYRDGSLP